MTWKNWFKGKMLIVVGTVLTFGDLALSTFGISLGMPGYIRGIGAIALIAGTIMFSRGK